MNIGIARSNHIIQLSYVYSVSIVFTCCYALDSAVTVKSILVNLNIAAFKADASCASACTSDGLNTLQGSIHRQAVFVNYQVLLAILQLNINLLIGDGNTITCAQCCVRNLVLHIPYVGYRFILACINVGYICILGSYAGQICQFFVQLYLYSFASIAYFDVLVAAEVNSFAGCYIYSFTFAGRKFPALIGSFFYSIQLAAVYCVGGIFGNCTFFYAGNLLAVCVQTAVGDVCLIVITNTSIRHIELSCFYAVYSQILLQCQTSFSNLKVIFIQLHRNCIIFSANGNTITSSIYRTGFDSILLTIDFNTCCSLFSTNSLYLRTGSKGFSFRICSICSIRNLNKSIFAASTSTAGNGNSTINSLIAISQQTDSCRICFAIQSNFFNIVTTQLIIIFL